MDHDELTNKRVHAIARAHRCTIDDVHAALDRHPIELNRDAYLKRTLALELMRLDQLEMAFEGKALRDKDVAAGVLMAKILERTASSKSGRSASKSQRSRPGRHSLARLAGGAGST